MNTTIHRLAFVLCLTHLAIAQEHKPLSDAGISVCEYADKGGGIGKWVTSNAGFSAAPELRAIVSGNQQQRHCTTTWNLHIRGKDEKERIVRVGEREDVPEDNEWSQENSFEINAWSKDGSLLLTSQVEAQGDWDETTPIIYDFFSGKYWRIPLHPLLAKLIPADCYVVYRSLRFATDGSVLFSAQSTDDDREPGKKACFPESFWRLDFRKSVIQRSHVPALKTQ